MGKADGGQEAWKRYLPEPEEVQGRAENLEKRKAIWNRFFEPGEDGEDFLLMLMERGFMAPTCLGIWLVLIEQFPKWRPFFGLTGILLTGLFLAVCYLQYRSCGLWVKVTLGVMAFGIAKEIGGFLAIFGK
jgi:hypothetical protein